jgi:UDP-N-acetylenolpyruvoylglucosamine reductase
MNAGAMGGWMFDVVESVEVLTLAGERQTWRREELTVGYRHCRELESAIAVSAVLRPHDVSEAEAVGRQIDVYRSKRQESQPREPSAGCIFKNPEGDSAGRLVDAGGLKGTREGGAEVSVVHGNFIVNQGGASCADVVRLVRRVRAEVKQQTGIELQPEVLLFGANWEDVL